MCLVCNISTVPTAGVCIIANSYNRRDATHQDPPLSNDTFMHMNTLIIFDSYANLLNKILTPVQFMLNLFLTWFVIDNQVFVCG